MATINKNVGMLITPAKIGEAYLKMNTPKSKITGMAKAAFLRIVFAVIVG